jgi:hypothetical protein
MYCEEPRQKEKEASCGYKVMGTRLRIFDLGFSI